MSAKGLGFMAATAAFVAACAGASTAHAYPGDRATAGAYRLEVVDASGSGLRSFDHNGRTYVLGSQGDRYRIRVYNQTNRRIEAVVSVDGRDAIDGKPARFDKPGYLIGPYGSATIDGFRLSMRDVAAFRFSDVADSYAAQVGDASNVGIIGVAVFSERVPQPPLPIRRPYPEEAREKAGYDDRAAAKKDAGGGRAAPAPSSEPRSADSSAKAPQGRTESERAERPGLGTAFGERTHSPVVQMEFQRARPSSPDVVLATRYNDHAGLVALGIDVDGNRWRRYHYDAWQREAARPFVDIPRSFAPPPPGWAE